MAVVYTNKAAGAGQATQVKTGPLFRLVMVVQYYGTSVDLGLSHLDHGFLFDLEAVSETTRSSLTGYKFQNFPGGACPQTPLAWACSHTP